MTQSIASNENSNNQVSKKSLTFNRRKKLPSHQLPFVNKVKGKVGLSFWSVPKTGGYAGGNITGHALALLYLKHIRANGSGAGGLLQCVALDMFDTDLELDNPVTTSLRGQAVGFFLELENIIKAATVQMGDCLDDMDEKELLRRANEGINLNEDEFTRDMLIAIKNKN